MNILADFHHQGLYYSLQLLFEKRLGHHMFRPIGMEWFEEGFWKINDQVDTAKQYLDIDSQPKDNTQPLNNKINGYEGIYHFSDLHHYSANYGITLETFKKMDIDIVIASIPQHIEPFKKLAEMKGAKFIFQMGNVFPGVDLYGIPNFMLNTIPPNLPDACNWIRYHQEFPLDIFQPTTFAPSRLITSFINVYRENAGYTDYAALKSIMPDFEFKSYGGQCDDGTITGIDNLSAAIQDSVFVFHSKYGGDGYGHILYNTMACGKPVITRISDYKGKMGEELLIDGETCIDLDKHTFEEVKNKIENIPPYRYAYMCQAAYNQFTSKVDFAYEASMIEDFINNLL